MEEQVLEEEEEETPGARDISKISVGSFELEQSGRNKVKLVGSITNSAETTAQNIRMDVKLYNEEGEIIYSKPERLGKLKPGESKPVSVKISIPKQLISRHEVRITNVIMRQF